MSRCEICILSSCAGLSISNFVSLSRYVANSCLGHEMTAGLQRCVRRTKVTACGIRARGSQNCLVQVPYFRPLSGNNSAPTEREEQPSRTRPSGPAVRCWCIKLVVRPHPAHPYSQAPTAPTVQPLQLACSSTARKTILPLATGSCRYLETTC